MIGGAPWVISHSSGKLTGLGGGGGTAGATGGAGGVTWGPTGGTEGTDLGVGLVVPADSAGFDGDGKVTKGLTVQAVDVSRLPPQRNGVVKGG